MSRSSRRAFTLVELLVVVLIILLVSAVVLGTILPDLMHGQVTEAARQLQAAFVLARAEAVKNNAPRGIRLLPDPAYSTPGTSILAFNRWVAIEPGPDYSNGNVTVWPLYDSVAANAGLPAPPQFAGYPGGGAYPYLSQAMRAALYGSPQPPGQVLMIEEAPFRNNDVTAGLNNPTSWFWNVRVGDKIRIGGAGRAYTVVGPCVRNPSTGQNPEMFVNDGDPGQPTTLNRFYTDPTGSVSLPAPGGSGVEYLFVVNGIDDDNDGFVDNGWDGYDNNFNGVVDDMAPVTGNNGLVLWEWSEVEQWTGAERGTVGALTGGYAGAVANTTLPTNLPQPSGYTITRRPVPSPGAQEYALPSSVTIDATTWNATQERSRLPIDPNTKTVDVLFNPNGSVVLTTAYSAPTAFSSDAAFYHFWIAERQDVQEAQPGNSMAYQLPMPQGTANYASPRYLQGQRALVTLFARTGHTTANAIEFFNGADINTPFYDSQLGAREAK